MVGEKAPPESWATFSALSKMEIVRESKEIQSSPAA